MESRLSPATVEGTAASSFFHGSIFQDSRGILPKWNFSSPRQGGGIGFNMRCSSSPAFFWDQEEYKGGGGKGDKHLVQKMFHILVKNRPPNNDGRDGDEKKGAGRSAPPPPTRSFAEKMHFWHTHFSSQKRSFFWGSEVPSKKKQSPLHSFFEEVTIFFPTAQSSLAAENALVKKQPGEKNEQENCAPKV